jgi:hypothetical protein
MGERFVAVLLVLGLAIGYFPALAVAHGPSAPPHQSYSMGDFKLESGERSEERRVG